MLKDNEKEFVKLCLQKYPQGVPPKAWGFGPMAVKKDTKYGYTFAGPRTFNDIELKKYGWPAVQLAVARKDSENHFCYNGAVSDIASTLNITVPDYTRQLSKDPKKLAEKL